MLKQVYTFMVLAYAITATAQQADLSNPFTNQLNKPPHLLQQESGSRSAGKRLAHTLYYYGVNQQWSLNDSSKYIYPNSFTGDVSGNGYSELLSYTWNNPSQIFVGNYTTTQTYNGMGFVTSRIQQIWDGSQWLNQFKYTFDYSGNGYYTGSHYYTWFANAWQEISSDVSTLNGQDLVIERIVMDTVGGMLTNKRKYAYTYDGQNRQTQYIEQRWVTGTWENFRKENAYFTGSATKRDSTRMSGWNTGTNIWDAPYDKTIYTYGLANLLTEQVRYLFSNNTWNNTSRYTFTYNVNGYETERSNYTWQNNQWRYNSKDTYTYNINDQLSEGISQNWNSTTQQLQNYYRYTYAYDTDGDYLQYENYSWANNAWDKNNKGVYYYEAIQSSSVETFAATSTAHAYPNPFTVNTIIEFTAATPGTAQISIADINGRTVYSHNMFTATGNNNFLWNAETADGKTLPAGMYVVQIKQNDISVFSKLLKQ